MLLWVPLVKGADGLQYTMFPGTSVCCIHSRDSNIKINILCVRTKEYKMSYFNCSISGDKK